MPEIKIGDIVCNKTNGNFGVAVEIEPVKKTVIAAHGPEDEYRIKAENADFFTPPVLTGDFVYGQFVKDRFVGMMVKVKDDKYIALCPDGKCYPKGKKYETGHWYKLAEIKPVTEEEKKEFVFKLNAAHTPEEYQERLELTKAEWRAKGLEPEVKRFELFWERLISKINGKPGINWGARLKTVFAPEPSLNLTKNTAKDMQGNMFCFISLGSEVKTGRKQLSVFIKESVWICESARVYFPRSGDGKFYPPGHATVFNLDSIDNDTLMFAADSLAASYLSANK